MREDYLIRNLQRYPRLTDLFLTDVVKGSRFLMSIKTDMERKPLTSMQAYKACRAILERTKSEIPAKG